MSEEIVSQALNERIGRTVPAGSGRTEARRTGWGAHRAGGGVRFPPRPPAPAAARVGVLYCLAKLREIIEGGAPCAGCSRWLWGSGS